MICLWGMNMHFPCEKYGKVVTKPNFGYIYGTDIFWAV